MNKEVVRKWVDALRSGEFKQTKGRLSKIENDDTRTFCCLGVLCELAKDAGVIGDENYLPFTPSTAAYREYKGEFSYAGEEALPPIEVAEFVGDLGRDWNVTINVDVFDPDDDPEDEDAGVRFGAGERVALAELNDEGNWTFGQIADALEAEYLQ